MNRRSALAFAGCAAIALAAACGSDDKKLTGVGEPIVVSGGQFETGPLPGTPPPPPVSSDAGPMDAGAADATPALFASTPTFSSTTVPAGEPGKSFGGEVTSDAVAVGVSMAGMGTGYWVVPAGSPDPMAPTELNYSIKANFSSEIPAGKHDMLVVGIGPTGEAGQQRPLSLCFGSPIPDNNHGCVPSQKPPAAVMSLHWDANFDLDLHVILPDGTDVNPKVVAPEPEGGPPLPTFDRDSFRGCVVDGLRREDLVFQDGLPAGPYLIYVNPFAPCGSPAVRFTFSLYQTTGTCPDCQQVVTTTKSGELLASQVTGDPAATGLFVDQLNVN
jgi:hypothetical protein